MLRNLINAPLAISAASLGAVALYLVVQFPTLVQSVFVGGADVETLQTEREITHKKHEVFKTDDVATIIGRSPFSTPLPTPSPVIHRDPPPQPTTPIHVEPPKPTTYTGPSPLGMFGSTVPFKRPGPNDPPFYLEIGESAHGITLMSANPPWSVHVKYQGQEFDVAINKSVDFNTLSNTFKKSSTSGLPIQSVQNTKSNAENGTAPESHAAAANGDEPADGDTGETADQPAATAPDETAAHDNVSPADEGTHDESDKVQNTAQPEHSTSRRRPPKTF